MNVSELLGPAPTVQKPEFDTALWYHSAGNSIYLKFLPQDMTKEDLQAAFAFLGQINRIDIVNSAPNKTTGATYRMVFIHFDFWYSTPTSMDLRGQILAAYPRPFQMYSSIAMRELSVTINTRPVPKTNYNVDQLSDMFHRLQEQFTTTVENQAKEIEDLKHKVTELEKNHGSTEFQHRLTSHSIRTLETTVIQLAGEVDDLTDWTDRMCNDKEKIETDVKELDTSFFGNAVDVTRNIQLLFSKFNALDEYLISRNLGSFNDYVERSHLEKV